MKKMGHETKQIGVWKVDTHDNGFLVVRRDDGFEVFFYTTGTIRLSGRIVIEGQEIKLKA
jgi:hypothetical protein